MYYHCPVITAVFGTLILLIGVVSILYIIPKYKFHQTIKWMNGDQYFQYWQKSTRPTKFRIYFFNVENPEKVGLQSKPLLKEIGPFVYDKLIERNILDTHETADTIKYIKNEIYHFNSSASNYTEDTLITTINPVLWMMISLTRTRHIEDVLNDAIDEIFSNLINIFTKIPAKNLLFDSFQVDFSENYTFLCEIISKEVRNFVEADKACNQLSFSYLKYLNNSHDGPFVITRGLKRTPRNEFVSYKGGLNTWNNKYCYMINGTDLSIVSPMELFRKLLYTFRSEFCRSFYFELQHTEVFLGVSKRLKYTFHPKNLEMTEQFKCFCPSSNSRARHNCPKNGMMNMMKCWGIDFLLSEPYFGYGRASTDSLIDGNGEFESAKHQSYVIVEPDKYVINFYLQSFGVPLSWFFRYQINLEIKPNKHINLLANSTSIIYPLFWVEEECQVPHFVLDSIKDKLNYVKIMLIASFILVLFGIAIMILSTILLMKREQLMFFNRQPGLLTFKNFTKRDNIIIVKTTKEFLKLQSQYEHQQRMRKMRRRHHHKRY